MQLCVSHQFLFTTFFLSDLCKRINYSSLSKTAFISLPCFYFLFLENGVTIFVGVSGHANISYRVLTCNVYIGPWTSI